MMSIAKVLRDLCFRQPLNGQYHTVAIDGRGGSGKSTLAAAMQKHLNGWSIIAGDGYFEPIPDETKSLTSSGFVIWGEFNDERFRQDVLDRIQHGESLLLRPYSYERHEYEQEQFLAVERGVVVERCFTFTMPVAWDACIWVETSREVCLARAFEREQLPLEQVRSVWEGWQKKEDAYIADTHPRERADCIVDGEGNLSLLFDE
ncbi:MAG: uridine kinase family protein [Candidatus Dormibacteria bacterium]